jgi:hypothetical protein
MNLEFKAWPKTPRLKSPVTISEKLHGSNGAVIARVGEVHSDFELAGEELLSFDIDLFAQTRNRLVTVDDDQTGIAKWVQTNSATLMDDLVYGALYRGEMVKEGIFYHYGEFMKRGHKEPHFYLFNTRRWGAVEFKTPTLKVVPVLYEGEYYEGIVEECLNDLRENGSRVHPGVPAEGVVVYWQHDDTMKKAYTGFIKQ